MDKALRQELLETMAVVLRSDLPHDMVMPISRTMQDFASLRASEIARLWELPRMWCSLDDSIGIRSSVWITENAELVVLGQARIQTIREEQSVSQRSRMIVEESRDVIADCFSLSLVVIGSSLLEIDVTLEMVQPFSRNLREKAIDYTM